MLGATSASPSSAWGIQTGSGISLAVDSSVVKFHLKLDAVAITAMAVIAAVFSAINHTNSWGTIGAFIAVNGGEIIAGACLIAMVVAMGWFFSKLINMELEHRDIAFKSTRSNTLPVDNDDQVSQADGDVELSQSGDDEGELLEETKKLATATTTTTAAATTTTTTTSEVNTDKKQDDNGNNA